VNGLRKVLIYSKLNMKLVVIMIRNATLEEIKDILLNLAQRMRLRINA